MQRTNGELFEIQGRQKSGKTTTIHLAWDLLLQHPEAQAELVDRGHGRLEIKGGILDVNGVLVGFMSKSEPVRILLAMLQALAEEGSVDLPGVGLVLLLKDGRQVFLRRGDARTVLNDGILNRQNVMIKFV